MKTDPLLRTVPVAATAALPAEQRESRLAVTRGTATHTSSRFLRRFLGLICTARIRLRSGCASRDATLCDVEQKMLDREVHKLTTLHLGVLPG